MTRQDLLSALPESLAKDVAGFVADHDGGIALDFRLAKKDPTTALVEQLLRAVDHDTVVTRLNMPGAKLGSKDVKRLVELPALSSLQHLGLAGNKVTKAGLQAVARTNIASLDLSHNKVGASLAALSGMKNLSSLQLRWTGTTGKSLATLGKADLPALRKLGLVAASVYVTQAKLFRVHKYAEVIDGTPSYSAADLEGLVDSQLGDQLTHLALAENNLDAGACEVLTRLAKLERLNLRQTRVGWDGAVALAKGLPSLRSLDLQRSLPKGKVPRFGSAPFARTLRHLELRNAQLGVDTQLEKLLEGTHMTDLGLYGCQLTDAVAPWLAAREGMTRLDVRNNSFSAQGVERLLAGPAAATVEELALSGNAVRDPAIEAVVGAELPALRRLFLAGVGVTDAGLERLVAHPGFQQLETLELHNNSLSNASAERLLEHGKHLRSLTLSDNALVVDKDLVARLETTFVGMQVGRQDPGVLPPQLVEGWGGVRFDRSPNPRERAPEAITPKDSTIRIDGNDIFVDDVQVGTGEYDVRAVLRVGDTVLASVHAAQWECRLDVYVRTGAAWSRVHRIECGWFGKHLVPMLDGRLVAVVSGSQSRLALLGLRDGQVRDLGRLDVGPIAWVGPDKMKLGRAVYHLAIDEPTLDTAFDEGQMPDALRLGVEPRGVTEYTRHWP